MSGITSSDLVFALAAQAGVSRNAANELMDKHGIPRAAEIIVEKLGRVAVRAEVAPVAAAQERAARDAQTAPAQSEPATATLVVPRIKHGLRAIDSPATRDLHPIYRAVWKALYAMAKNAEDRVVRTTLGRIAERAAQLHGKAVAVDTTRAAIDYLALIGAVMIVQKPGIVKGLGGRLQNTPGQYAIPLLEKLDARAIRDRIKANQQRAANQKEADRKRAERHAAESGTSPPGGALGPVLEGGADAR